MEDLGWCGCGERLVGRGSARSGCATGLPERETDARRPDVKMCEGDHKAHLALLTAAAPWQRFVLLI